MEELELTETWDNLFKYLPDSILIEKAVGRLIELSEEERQNKISAENLHILKQFRKTIKKI